jgi:hypothetical protein
MDMMPSTVCVSMQLTISRFATTVYRESDKNIFGTLTILYPSRVTQ